jgi:hypothetical protein
MITMTFVVDVARMITMTFVVCLIFFRMALGRFESADSTASAMIFGGDCHQGE